MARSLHKGDTVTHRALAPLAHAGLALVASIGLLAAPGCAEESEPDVVTGDEQDLKDVERTGGKSQKWIYQGPMPKL